MYQFCKIGVKRLYKNYNIGIGDMKGRNDVVAYPNAFVLESDI